MSETRTAPDARTGATGAGRPRSARPAFAGGAVIGGGAILLILAAFASIGVGSTGIDPAGSLAALLSGDDSTLASLVRDSRLPRMLLAALVGAGLAVAGQLAQALTRNPLASPQTFGINAGAAAAIVLSVVVFPQLAAPGVPFGYAGVGLAGAALVGLVMWSLSTTGAVTVVGLALAGVTIQIVLSALVQALLIMDNATQDLVFWLAGSVTGAQWTDVALLAPAVAIGLLAAALGSRSFALLSLDAETAAGLGQHPQRTAGAAAAIVVVLAGTAVAVAGPIGFIGLIVPHIARRLVGGRFGPQLAACTVLGALLLVSADLLGRLIAFPSEMPAGIVTAVLGAPVFLFLAIRARRA